MKQKIIEIEEVGFPSSLIWRENAPISELINTINLVEELFSEVKKLNMPVVSGSLACQKAVEYAKFIHGEEYDDQIFAPDVEQTIRDFQSGFVTAMRISNDR